MKEKILITIDGLAASGKSTCANELCKITNWTLLSTGLAHRLNTWSILKNSIDINNPRELNDYLFSLKFNFIIKNNSFIPTLNGSIISKKELHSKDVITLLPKVTRIPEVCLKLTEIYRDLVKSNNVIAEGHGLGTGIFPNADIKFFCDAPLEVRAKRRWTDQSQQNGETLYKVQENILERDNSDQNRKLNPVSITNDMHVIDTFNLSNDKCVQEMLKIIKNRYSLINF